MTCPQGTGSDRTKGLIIAMESGQADNGDRPAVDAQGNFRAFWASPNIQLVPAGDVANLETGQPVRDKWLDPNFWVGKDLRPNTVTIGDPYRLVMRVRNTDTTSRFPINFEAFVANLNVGEPTKANAIREVPGDTQNRRTVQFTPDEQLSASEVPPQNPENYEDPTRVRILVGQEIWRPTAKQVEAYGQHVCLAANVFSPGYTGEGDTPVDGGALAGAAVLPHCDRRHGQRNLEIVKRTVGTVETRTVMLAVPATDRCALEGEVALKELRLAQGDAQLAGLATELGMDTYHCPEGPFDQVTIDDCGDPSHEIGVCVAPGETFDVQLTIAPYEGEKPGDVYAFDMITTDEANDRIYGAARFYVMVTA